MTRLALIAAAAGTIVLAAATPARGSAEGPATPQAVAAHAEFLATLPAPPGGAAAVCVIDSGVDTTTDLGPALVKRSAYDGGPGDDTGALGDTGEPLPKHGTYVAGVIGSQIDGVGTNGIWPAARVLSRRVFPGPGGGTTAQDYIRAIDWCLADPSDRVKVINLSLAGLSATLDERAALEDKIGQIRSEPQSVNVVAAAGNTARPFVGYPASADGVLAVGATDETGALARFSNRGDGLDISTLGTGTCLTSPTTTHLATGSGTSYAAPVVSAVLSALRSYRPALTPREAEEILLSTADENAGGKVLNAARAFVAAGVVTAAQADPSGDRLECSSAPVPVAPGASADVLDAETRTPASPQPAAVGAPVVDSTLTRSPATRAESALPKPTLTALWYRAGVLSIRVSPPVSGAQTLFRIRSGRRTVTRLRSSGAVTVRARRWTVARVWFVSPNRRSAPLILQRSGVL